MTYLSNKRTLGLHICAGISLAVALVLIALAAYVFTTRLEDLPISNSSSTKNPTQFPGELPGWETKPSDNKYYQDALHRISAYWARYRPLLVSTSMLCILAGLLQAIFSALVVLSDAKAMLLYIRKWMCVSFILLFVLVIILINTIVLSEHNATDKERQQWNEDLDNVKHYLKLDFRHMDFSSLYRFLGVGEHLIYWGVGTDLTVILLVMGATLLLMRSTQGDYESYE